MQRDKTTIQVKTANLQANSYDVTRVLIPPALIGLQYFMEKVMHNIYTLVLTIHN